MAGINKKLLLSAYAALTIAASALGQAAALSLPVSPTPEKPTTKLTDLKKAPEKKGPQLRDLGLPIDYQKKLNGVKLTELDAELLKIAQKHETGLDVLVPLMLLPDWGLMNPDIKQQLIDSDKESRLFFNQTTIRGGNLFILPLKLKRESVARIQIEPNQIMEGAVFDPMGPRPDLSGSQAHYVDFSLSATLQEKLMPTDKKWAKDLESVILYNLRESLSSVSQVSSSSLTNATGKAINQVVFMPQITKPYPGEKPADFRWRQDDFIDQLRIFKVPKNLQYMFQKTGIMVRVSDFEGRYFNNPPNCDITFLTPKKLAGTSIPVLIFNSGHVPKTVSSDVNKINKHMQERMDFGEKWLQIAIQDLATDASLSSNQKAIATEYGKTLDAVLKNKRQLVAQIERDRQQELAKTGISEKPEGVLHD